MIPKNDTKPDLFIYILTEIIYWLNLRRAYTERKIS